MVVKWAVAASIVIAGFSVEACGSKLSPQVTTAASTGSRQDSAFHGPTTILAPTIANDSPGQSWNYPNDPAKVIHNLYAWLSTAKVTTVHLPKVNQNVKFADYIGPSELFFSDQKGNRITVAPAYYIAHGKHGYYPALIKNIVSYRQGGRTTYLKSPQLFQWLGNDSNWESEFRMESFTEADQQAISDIKSSKWGGRFTSLFPSTPGIDKRDISRGGPETAKSSSTVPCTMETLVDSAGVNRRIMMIEVWDNGRDQHRWVYVVSPSGTIVSHQESGATPPQDWR